MLSDSQHYFDRATDVLGLSPKIRAILLTPRRCVKVEIVVESDDVSTRRAIHRARLPSASTDPSGCCSQADSQRRSQPTYRNRNQGDDGS